MSSKDLVSILARAIAGQARRELKSGIPAPGQSSTVKENPPLVAAGGEDNKSPGGGDHAATRL